MMFSTIRHIAFFAICIAAGYSYHQVTKPELKQLTVSQIIAADMGIEWDRPNTGK